MSNSCFNNNIKKRHQTDLSQETSTVDFQQTSAVLLPVAVNCMIFLVSRPMLPDYGRLLVSLANGLIQVYSHISYIDAFNATHLPGDYVTSMTTDIENRYLFTATQLGYLKTWLIINFCIPDSEITHINWPKMRLAFPFLIKDSSEGLAKQFARTFNNPILVNSYKAHTKCINSIVYVDESKMMITGSVDFTVRMWTLSGRYIRTFGSPINLEIPPTKYENLDDLNFKSPPDVRRIASKTTLKVLNGAKHSDALVQKLKLRKDELFARRMIRKGEITDLHTYGRQLSEFTLNRAVLLSPRDTVGPKLVLKVRNTSAVPVFKHLKMHHVDAIKMPERPKVIENLKKFYEKNMKIA